MPRKTLILLGSMLGYCALVLLVWNGKKIEKTTVSDVKISLRVLEDNCVCLREAVQKSHDAFSELNLGICNDLERIKFLDSMRKAWNAQSKVAYISQVVEVSINNMLKKATKLFLSDGSMRPEVDALRDPVDFTAIDASKLLKFRSLSGKQREIWDEAVKKLGFDPDFKTK